MLLLLLLLLLLSQKEQTQTHTQQQTTNKNQTKINNQKNKQKSAPEITALALDETPDDPRAVEAVDIFLAVVGAEAGAMGLRCLAKGGVYIAGGIIPRLMKRLGGDGGVLKAAFVNRAGRERFHRLLLETPLYVVTNTKVGIIGSREYALRLVRSGAGGGGVSRR